MKINSLCQVFSAEMVSLSNVQNCFDTKNQLLYVLLPQCKENISLLSGNSAAKHIGTK
jgi:hypothetical protein